MVFIPSSLLYEGEAVQPLFNTFFHIPSHTLRSSYFGVIFAFIPNFHAGILNFTWPAHLSRLLHKTPVELFLSVSFLISFIFLLSILLVFVILHTVVPINLQFLSLSLCQALSPGHMGMPMWHLLSTFSLLAFSKFACLSYMTPSTFLQALAPICILLTVHPPYNHTSKVHKSIRLLNLISIKRDVKSCLA